MVFVGGNENNKITKYLCGNQKWDESTRKTSRRANVNKVLEFVCVCLCVYLEPGQTPNGADACINNNA